MHPTPRQSELLRQIQRLDPTKRHRLTLVCRGTEPWELLEHIQETRILPPPSSEGERRGEDVKAA